MDFKSMSEMGNAMGVTIGPHGLISHHYSVGFVFLSYLISFSGCWTSLELLHRRTGSRGLYNWYLLLAAACSMGPVAIWSMHFIGNRAVVMDKGQRQAQIQYSPGFTAASFFVPTIVVAVAFFFFSISEKVSILGTVLGGHLTGAAVCGMHYMGQGGIANYRPVYSWHNVVGSAIVSIVATTLALGAFFYFKSKWTGVWWKRVSCALFLALGVSTMHWLATIGTVYHLKANRHFQGVVGLSRKATVTVVMALCMGCCIALMVFACLGQRSRRRSADRAQQVVLACAIFDPDGKLMVTPEGLLPSRKITDAFHERSFEDVFDINHPVFCWVYRASRCWHCITELIPGIRSHLRNAVPKELLSPYSTCSPCVPCSPPPNPEEPGEPTAWVNFNDYATLFKESFCVAAHDLAVSIQEPLEDIGVLYGGIMSTGTLSRTARLKIHGLKLHKTALDLAERGESLGGFGRGQLLFLHRQADRSESARLQATGHNFAEVSIVAEPLARSMEVTREELLPVLENMRASAFEKHVLQPGVHLASFAIRPVHQKGFDVVVRKEAINLLPSTFLQQSSLEQWQVEYLQRLDKLTVATCCELLQEQRMVFEDREFEFAAQLLEGILQLKKTINNPYFSEARLVARPLAAPCNPVKINGIRQDAFLVSFRSILDAHQDVLSNMNHQFTPLRFFRCQQHAYKESSDNHIFAGQIHRDFAGLAKHVEAYRHRPSSNSPHLYNLRSSSETACASGDRTPSPVKKKKKHWASLVNVKTSDKRDYDNSTEMNLVRHGHTQPYGGIHVSNEITVDISELQEGDRSTASEMSSPQIVTEVGPGGQEPDSFADHLMAIITKDQEDRKKQRFTSY